MISASQKAHLRALCILAGESAVPPQVEGALRELSFALVECEESALRRAQRVFEGRREPALRELGEALSALLGPLPSLIALPGVSSAKPEHYRALNPLRPKGGKQPQPQGQEAAAWAEDYERAKRDAAARAERIKCGTATATGTPTPAPPALSSGSASSRRAPRRGASSAKRESAPAATPAPFPSSSAPSIPDLAQEAAREKRREQRRRAKEKERKKEEAKAKNRDRMRRARGEGRPPRPTQGVCALARCGAAFAVNLLGVAASYCSDRCANKAFRDRSGRRAPLRTCLACSKEIPRPVGQKGGARLYCKGDCQRARVARNRRAKRTKRRAREPLPLAPCVHCGKEFQPRTKVHSFCALKCKKDHRNQRRRGGHQ